MPNFAVFVSSPGLRATGKSEGNTFSTVLLGELSNLEIDDRVSHCC